MHRFLLLAALAVGEGALLQRLSLEPRAQPRASMPRAQLPATDPAVALEDELLALASGAARGTALTDEQRSRLEALAQELEALPQREPSSSSPLLPGRWRVLFQGKGGERTSFTDPESWKKYLSGDGPSPVQNLVSDSSNVGRLYQILELDDGVLEPGKDANGRFLNVVDFSESGWLRGVLAIEARLEGTPAPSRLGFRFTGGRLLLRTIWQGTLDLPYPVPFKLLGDNALGWLQTDYISPRLRLSRGNKGSLFVLSPEPQDDADVLQRTLLQNDAEEKPPPEKPPTEGGDSRAPVLLCPAQFGTAGDYSELVAVLEARGHPTYVAPLKRFDWFRLLPAALTAEYWKGELRPQTALPFYFEALDAAAERIRKEHPGKPVQLVAHSIGGWIARAYLGQLDEQARASFGTLVTLGSPHGEPPEGPLRTLDQTRGLLNFVNSNYPGAYHPSVRYLSVGSRAVKGQAALELEALLAFASYLPLSGEGGAEGDGIIPLKTAQLEGAEQRVFEEVFHIAFLPFLGTRLIGTPWYGSPEFVEEWADFLE